MAIEEAYAPKPAPLARLSVEIHNPPAPGQPARVFVEAPLGDPMAMLVLMSKALGAFVQHAQQEARRGVLPGSAAEVDALARMRQIFGGPG